MADGDGHADGRGQPIGYNSQFYIPMPLATGPLLDPRLVDNLGTPTTRTQAEGLVTWGRGQAPAAASSAPLLGLCAT